jgi:2,4-dienoyl-CoA reductase-like NADH-dependent reductase (Old Yellow Enzyme family)
MSTTHLASDFTLPCGTHVKNRLLKSAMSEQLSDRQNNPTAALTRLYRTWADGGVGICITGNVMVDRNALGEPLQVVLDTQSRLDKFTDWAEAGTLNNTQLWMQLNHPGKQVPNFLCKTPVAPSAIALAGALEKGFNKPRALEEEEILTIIDQFATSARLARQTGFTGVQIHGAHGYLISQFLSPRHNQRTDRWGGSLKNRMRFVLEVYKAVREATGPDYPVSIKLNSADFQKDGFAEADSMTVVQTLADAGMDLIEISGGTYESPVMTGHRQKASTLKREAYFLEYAEKVRANASVPLAVTGGFRSAAAMAQALATGATDFIGLARPMCLETDFPAQLMHNPAHALQLPRLSTGVHALDQVAMLDVTWYEHQLARIGAGLAPDPGLSPLKSLAKTLSGVGIHALRSRRA